MPSTRPEEVLIVGKRYRIRVVTERADGFEEGDYGMCDNDSLVISIVAGRSIGNDQDTLLHEVIHAVEFQMGVDGSIHRKPSHEHCVQALATGLLAFIKDNPSTVTYLRRRK